MRNIEPNVLQFPKVLGLLREIRKAAEQGQLTPECATVWLDTGVYPDEIYVKFNVAENDYRPTSMQTAATQLLAFLRRFPGFADACIQNYGQLGIRDGGRIRGEYCLTERDVITGRQFTDTACQASWPIEHWHPDQGITLQYLPAGQSYAIPLRSLKVAGFSNLWAAGKCLSAEPRAQASARVVGTCWAMGAAIGKHISENLQ
ncbi:FAD dependent oxidoreductase [Thiothrix caldifontis]|uniref:FAD dependent oxidoreductase n=1 Tax=Thiothrix caldifontis TaxID=525918 RepID=A0A1H4GTU3_9GAMM|nr:FAD-dependent oxidoreductase [Thiothrix caldifontis]SEB12995.1 FAD dependent oxidoreductase [Thiothrix caldifontis]